MKKMISIGIVSLLVIGGFIGVLDFENENNERVTQNTRNIADNSESSESRILGYTPHDPIYIDGNENFTAENGVSNPGAAGTATDPYIIEGWNISTSSVHGIEIRNTNAYFITKNCYVHDGKYDYNYGIYFYNITNGWIENINSSDNYYGICLTGSSNNTVSNNNASNNQYGIFLGSSSYNNIYNNNASNNGDGIYLRYSSNNNVSDNNVSSNNVYGIRLYSSSNNTISNNSASNNHGGINLESSSYNNVFNNNANSNNHGGIYLYWESNNNNIFNNTANSNNWCGVSLSDWSNNNNISNNNASNNDYGIRMSSSSNNNNISNNSASNNDHGIYLWFWSNNNNIFNNSVNSNNVYGIYLYYGSSSNNIFNNSASNNEYGIYLKFYSINNTFVFNNISYNNCSVEIYDSNCENNTFHHNNFINGSGVNVIDYGLNTKWDDGYGEGNYWSNYTGLDNGFNGRVAGDGVGDTNIPHMGLDNYPLMEPVGEPYTPDTTPPVISSVIVSEITDTAATITWTTDEFSDSRVNYSINADLSSNSTKYDSTMTTTHSITLIGLSPETTYYFEVSSTDGYGNTATDTNSSNYYKFTTSEEDTTPPVISSVAVSGITENSATITWTTDEFSDSRVNYSINADLSSNSTKYDSTMTTSHSITLIGLNPETTYYFEVSSTDDSRNIATDSNNSNYYRLTTLGQDITPPVISSVSLSDIKYNSATITWITDENTDSRINYSMNSDLSSSVTKYDSTMTTTHSITITGLSPSTIYYFEVSSTDGSGNTATDDNSTIYYTFTTEAPTTEEPGFPIIDYWWVILLVVIIVIIVVIVWMSKRR